MAYKKDAIVGKRRNRCQVVNSRWKPIRDSRFLVSPSFVVRSRGRIFSLSFRLILTEDSLPFRLSSFSTHIHIVTTGNNNMSKPMQTNVVFSAGLGPRGRAGAWIAALAVAVRICVSSDSIALTSHVPCCRPDGCIGTRMRERRNCLW